MMGNQLSLGVDNSHCAMINAFYRSTACGLKNWEVARFRLHRWDEIRFVGAFHQLIQPLGGLFTG